MTVTVPELLVTIVVAIFGSTGFWSWMQNRKRKKSNETKLLMGIAYTKIIQQCDYYLERGWISTDEYHELFHYLYQPYEAMGGNGTAKRQMELVKNLPPKQEVSV